jgi:hypothetical protein
MWRANSMAPGNAGLIGLTQPMARPRNASRPKRAVTLKLFAMTMELVKLRGRSRSRSSRKRTGRRPRRPSSRPTEPMQRKLSRLSALTGRRGVWWDAWARRRGLRVGWDAAAVERGGWVKVGGRASSRNYLQLLLDPPCIRTPFLSLRLR